MILVLLVYGPSHVVDHRKTADGLQKVVIWPAGNIRYMTEKMSSILFSIVLFTQKWMTTIF